MLYNNDDILINKHLFTEWYEDQSSSQSKSYKEHAVDVLDFWLEDKLPGNDIGCLFRFDDFDEFKTKLKFITQIENYKSVNNADQRGRTNAALNYFKKYLKNKVYQEYFNNKVYTNSIQTAPIIDCRESLVQLVLSGVSANLTEEEKLKYFAEHMITKTYFFSPDAVNKRHHQIISALAQNQKLPVRFSTKPDAYCNARGNIVQFKNKTQAREVSRTTNIYCNLDACHIPVYVDKDGNYEVRTLIQTYSKARVSQGSIGSNVRSAVISHIFGNAFHPIFFSNLWNIVIVPDYLNPILDKVERCNSTGSTYFDKIVSYVKTYYKNYLYKLYNLDSKIEDYKNLGIDISELCCFDNSFKIESNLNPIYIDEVFQHN